MELTLEVKKRLPAIGVPPDVRLRKVLPPPVCRTKAVSSASLKV
jgi:hypothetical protein